LLFRSNLFKLFAFLVLFLLEKSILNGFEVDQDKNKVLKSNPCFFKKIETLASLILGECKSHFNRILLFSLNIDCGVCFGVFNSLILFRLKYLFGPYFCSVCCG